MKKKKYIALIAALTLSSAFVLNGCSLALPGEETKIGTGAELSAEQEILTDGNVQLHTRWYNADGSRLVGATVTVYDGNDQLSYSRGRQMKTEIWKHAHFRATKNFVV